MLHDVGIAERQKVRDKVQISQSYNPPYISFFCYTCIMKKKSLWGGCILLCCFLLCRYAGLNFYLLCKISSLMLRHLATTSNTRR